MSFDFAKAIKDSQAQAKESLLEAIILGPSGAGKSTVMGTFGVKTLYLYTSGENHGAKAAASNPDADVLPLCVDRDGDTVLDSDTTFRRLLDVLAATTDLKKLGVKAIAVDGASELEAVIRSTSQWRSICATKDGKHNSFAEPTATAALFRQVTGALKSAQRELGCHFAVSCILDAKELDDDGSIVEASPRLQGFSVAETLIQQFGDVLVVGRIRRDDVVKHKIQFMVDLPKVSKDATGRIKRAINFSPRLAGVRVENLPPYLDADLASVVAFKRNGGKK